MTIPSYLDNRDTLQLDYMADIVLQAPKEICRFVEIKKNRGNIAGLPVWETRIAKDAVPSLLEMEGRRVVVRDHLGRLFEKNFELNKVKRNEI